MNNRSAKAYPCVILAAMCLSLVVGCSPKRDFVAFLAEEIAATGGKTNNLNRSDIVLGRWTVKRDKHGAAIDTSGITFAEVAQILTPAYGEPVLYANGNERAGPMFLYSPTNAGISIFIGSGPSGAQVTLLNPLFLK